MGSEDPEPEAAAADAVETKNETESIAPATEAIAPATEAIAPTTENLQESAPPAENAKEDAPEKSAEESAQRTSNVADSGPSTENVEEKKPPTETTENESRTENADAETSLESSSKLENAEEQHPSDLIPQQEIVPLSDIDIIPYLQELEDQQEEEEMEEQEITYHYIEMLDAPRELLPPVDLTLKDLTHIANELGLIKLCWPDIEYPEFENRVNFPESYLTNSNKEKLLLLYTENFRRQFCHKYPHRKQLFLACANECGMQKMVCNTVRPTTLPYPEIETWQDCAKFVGEALKFEPYDIPTLIVSECKVFS